MVAAGRQDATGGATALNLFAPMGFDDLTCQVAGTVSGWVFSENFTMAIDPDTPTEEKLLCASIVGSSPATVTILERGYDNTNATNHNQGARVTHVFPATLAQDFERHIYDTTDDDHTQYLNTVRHQSATLHQYGVGKALGPGTTTPADIGTVAAAGTGASPARDDHAHELADGAIDAFTLFAAAVIGVVGNVQPLGGAAAAGTGTAFARVDHVHPVTDASIPTAKLLFPAGDHLGISVLTYAQISALAGADLWEGRRVYQTDTGTGRAVKGEYTYNGVAWRLPWNMPWGEVVAPALAGADATNYTAYADIVGMTRTFTAVANRRYEIELEFEFSGSVNGQPVYGRLVLDGATQLNERACAAGTNGFGSARVRWRGTLAAGSHTVTGQCQRSSGDPVTINIDASNPTKLTSLTWDDVGPAGVPA